MWLMQAVGVLQQRTEERLQELLSEGNYPGAIGLLLECRSAAATYRHFVCVAALSGKLQDTLEMAEEQLDQALAKVRHIPDRSNMCRSGRSAQHLAFTMGRSIDKCLKCCMGDFR
jgi:hypothetical protein